MRFLKVVSSVSPTKKSPVQMSERFQNYIKRAIQEINHRFTEPLSLDELSGICGVSRYYLSHEFHRYVGDTLIEYIILCRVNHAKELLKYSNLDMETISSQCGFRSASHFIRQFKAHVNMTPLQYRKKWSDPHTPAV